MLTTDILFSINDDEKGSDDQNSTSLNYTAENFTDSLAEQALSFLDFYKEFDPSLRATDPLQNSLWKCLYVLNACFSDNITSKVLDLFNSTIL